MKKHLLFAFALMLTVSLMAQHQAIQTTTDPAAGIRHAYSTVDNTLSVRDLCDNPEILWQKFESGAMPDDLFYIDATGDYLVYYGLNDKRVVLFEFSNGLMVRALIVRAQERYTGMNTVLVTLYAYLMRKHHLQLP